MKSEKKAELIGQATLFLESSNFWERDLSVSVLFLQTLHATYFIYVWFWFNSTSSYKLKWGRGQSTAYISSELNHSIFQ